ncbi:MAG: ECF-type sigma factor, partial [Candidatus Eisenbacteria bacterium]|nr:ECF-type sigma factor [Candidatus Eisenbacteria bacterium]
AQAMRRILVEHARARSRKKRGGGMEQVSLIDIPAFAPISRLDLLALDEALERLAAVDPRKERVVELLYFGGLTAAEAAAVLGVTSRTVERDWSYARLWLLREMEQGRRAAAQREADP